MMKKVFSLCFAILLTICMSISFVGCISFYCNPRGKDWYNHISLPSITNPFDGTYDGSYSIQIDKEGNVVFKTLDGEELKGTLSTSLNDVNPWTEVFIQFENGRAASGKCYRKNGGRTLQIHYDHKVYNFSDTRQMSKEEFETYRSQFIEFLTNVCETGNFPTQEEIANNDLYQQFTNYYQIDPCCGGPIEYETLEKATIEKIEKIEEWSEDLLLTIRINGESDDYVAYEGDSLVIVSIDKNGEFKEIAFSDIKEGECLVSRDSYYSNGETGYYIDRIFYIEK